MGLGQGTQLPLDQMQSVLEAMLYIQILGLGSNDVSFRTSREAQLRMVCSLTHQGCGFYQSGSAHPGLQAAFPAWVLMEEIGVAGPPPTLSSARPANSLTLECCSIPSACPHF